MEKNSFKILVIDDEEEIVNMIVRYFKIEGYEIHGVIDPFKALELIKKGNYKVVILDIVMPKLSGVDVLKRIKRIDGIIQIIMITGYVTMQNIVSSLSRGANDCMFKPFKDMKELKKAVDDSIHKLRRWHNVIGELQALK